jgi:hypothetical protein
MFYVDELDWKFIICLLDFSKNDFVEVDEALYQGVERPNILWILSFRKSDLDVAAEVMFLVGVWLLEHIICPLDVLKNVLREYDKAMFQGVVRPCDLILCFLDIDKKWLGRSRLRDVLISRMFLWTQNLPSGRLKNDFKSMKRCFKVCNFVSWASKTIWAIRLWWFK